MKNKHSVYLFVLTAFAAISFSLPGDYHYRRPLQGVTGAWHKVVLPNEIFDKSYNNLADLRIIGITATGDTIEAPYLLENSTYKEDWLFEFPTTILNRVKNDKGFFYTLDTKNSPEVNQLWPRFADANFDWKVTVSGSNDMKEWFTLVEDYRILSIQNELTTYRFQFIRFPLAKYRYYLLFVPAKSKPELLNVSVIVDRPVPSDSGSNQDVYRGHSIHSSSISINKETRQTIIDISLAQPVPVSYISMAVDEKYDYARPVRIEYLYDSTKTPHGWEYEYRSVQDMKPAMLSSLEAHEFRFGSVITSRLRITIENHDNTPLHPGSLVVKGYIYSLTARFTEPAAYYLYYGNRYAGKPVYDIANFSDSIPAAAALLTLGNEKDISAPEPEPARPLFENKAWLWGIMSLIIILLGGFTLSMIRKK